MKIIKRSAVGDKTEMIQTEIDILRKVRHKHIITLHEIYETKANIYLVMEL
jgi:calcium/calmodulin-dependent protein kinase I